MDADRPRVLVVDDEANQRNALASMIGGWGYSAETAENGADALSKLDSMEVAAVVTDLMMPVMDGAQFLDHLRQRSSPPRAIVVTAFGNLETALEVVHDHGAFWFLEKPLQPAALRLLLARATEEKKLADDKERLERQLASQGVLGNLVARSAKMQEVFSLIRQVAPTSATVLVTGESGTGKELAARAIHQFSSRASGPFVAVNCAAMPETLMESELFGHEKGAFTGAVERRRGCFELADGGTLLLDEIGEMPIATQAKLLRVLEDGKVRRLGAPRETMVNARVIASTNRNLAQRAAENAFREDLYFRLNVFHVHLPPLRERREDIAAITEALLPVLNARHGTRITGVDSEAMSALEAHDWPGNARELRNALERAVILAGEGTIIKRGLPIFNSSAKPTEQSNEDEVRLRPGATVDEAERALIELTLKHTGGNRTRAAALLGISQKTLFNKLREYGAAAE
jgi:DNA-binding NtrC family response regulator